RFGRVNRQRKKGICPIIVFTENVSSVRFIYKIDLIKKTLKVLNEMITTDAGIVNEWKLQAYIDQVYDKWDPKDYESFHKTYQLFTSSLNYLYPMFQSRRTEDDFYKQFDGIKVLPMGLKPRYIEHLSNFDFIGAERLMVQIRKKKFAQLVAEGDTTLFLDRYTFKGESGMISMPFWVLN